MSKTIYIGGRLESKEKGNVVTGANAILDDTKGKKQNVINKETDDELLRLEQSKQDNLNFDSTPTEDSTNPVTSGGVYTAEKALSDAIEAILLLIPSAATALNKLVDTNTMNSSISTATATFRGTYNAVSDLGLTYQATHAQIEAALDALGLTADNNDFAFVQIPVSDQSQDIAKTERFKFNGTNWLYEYDLNTSGFTASQWAAINSGITVALVTKLTDLPTAAALQLALNAKQDTLTFDNEPTALSQNPVTSGGIYTAIQAVATALSDYSTTTDGRLNILEGLIPTEASSSNKLTDKAYVDGLIQAITELIPAEADTTNQLADKAYVLARILAATPAFKGQFITLAELQAVASPKAGDLGIVRTKDSDGMDVFTVYQYLNNAWNVFYSLSYHPQTKPATTGTTGDYPYNGMGRVELVMNMVNTGTDLEPVMVNQLTQDMFYKGAVGSRVPNTNTIFVIRYDYVLGEDITIPANCVLEFDGGSISNGTINGEFSIDAPSVKILNNVGLPNYKKSFKFAWVVGNEINIDSSYFSKLPDTIIDFENKEYNLSGNIELNYLNNATFKNLNANIIGSMTHWMVGVSENSTGTCSYDDQGGYPDNTKIITSVALPQSYVGKIIEIKTADKVRYDWRDDANGVPTLYKGITSIILKIEGNSVTIADYIEPFSASKTYNSTVVTSRYSIFEPSRLNLENCNFVLRNEASIGISGYRYIINNCKITAPEGSETMLALGGHTGVVNNCCIYGAANTETVYQTNYGIQVHNGTNIVVKNSEFSDCRRAVDFSGVIETRYSEVRDCFIYNKYKLSDEVVVGGSAVGGHSTSYMNIYRHNTISGSFVIGVECRGEKEIVDGNILKCQCNTCITNGIDTTIINNIKNFDFNYNCGFVTNYIDDSVVSNNSIIIKNNDVCARDVFLDNIYIFGGGITIINNNISIKSNIGTDGYILSKTPVYLTYSGNNATNITLIQSRANEIGLNLNRCAISGITIPLELRGWNNTELPASDLAKLSIDYINLHLDTKQVIKNASPTGTIKLSAKFTITDTLSTQVILSSPKVDELIVASGFKGDLDCKAALTFNKTTVQGHDLCIVPARKIYIGLDDYAGYLQPGDYIFEAYL